MTTGTIIGIAIAAIVGLAAGFYLPSGKGIVFTSDQKKIDEAKEKAAKIRTEAKEKVKRIKEAFENEEKSTKASLQSLQEMVKQKEEILRRREQRNKSYSDRVNSLKKNRKNYLAKRDELVQESIDQLSSASGLTREKAYENSKKNLELLITEDKEKRQKAELEEFEEDIMRHAKAVLQVVIQRLAVQSSVDKNTSSLTVRDDKFKGLLIGKDGKNIKYLENLLPVSIIFNFGDDKTIHVGGVNLIRRNIAKRAINKLQKKVRKTKTIDHKLIKEAVEEAEKEIMTECDQKGTWALKKMDINPKDVPKELINYTGRLYFRTSYGQNVIHHSLEMAYAARLIAELTGNDVDVAMQAAFYHDIGKAIDHDVGGAHDDLSKEILEKHNYDPAIVHAAYAHHDKVPCESPEDFIVKAVDTISGGRPGARQESVTNYFERMKQLEDTAKYFEGVTKVFTMSAGREVRVMVNKDQIKDDAMKGLADDIAEKISEEVSFPGIIKVNLIRRTKSVDYAKEKPRR